MRTGGKMKEDTKITLKRILSEYESDLLYRLMEAQRKGDEVKLSDLKGKLSELETLQKEINEL